MYQWLLSQAEYGSKSALLSESQQVGLHCCNDDLHERLYIMVTLMWLCCYSWQSSSVSFHPFRPSTLQGIILTVSQMGFGFTVLCVWAQLHRGQFSHWKYWTRVEAMAAIAKAIRAGYEIHKMCAEDRYDWKDVHEQLMGNKSVSSIAKVRGISFTKVSQIRGTYRDNCTSRLSHSRTFSSHLTVIIFRNLLILLLHI